MTIQEQAKHTPGPWSSVAGERGPEIVDGTTLVLAEVNTFELHPAGSLPTRDEVLANARLIAAAPELLECLIDQVERSAALANIRTAKSDDAHTERMLNRLGPDVFDPNGRVRSYLKARAAIAKATGAQS